MPKYASWAARAAHANNGEVEASSCCVLRRQPDKQPRTGSSQVLQVSTVDENPGRTPGWHPDRMMCRCALTASSTISTPDAVELGVSGTRKTQNNSDKRSCSSQAPLKSRFVRWAVYLNAAEHIWAAAEGRAMACHAEPERVQRAPGAAAVQQQPLLRGPGWPLRGAASPPGAAGARLLSTFAMLGIKVQIEGTQKSPVASIK